jgi:hypothetical protein
VTTGGTCCGAGAGTIYIDGNDRAIIGGQDQVQLVNGTTPGDLSQGFTIEYRNADLSQLQLSQVAGSDGRQWLRVAFDATNILYLQNGFLDDGQAFNFGAGGRSLFSGGVTQRVLINLFDRCLVLDRGKTDPVAVTVGLKLPAIVDATVDFYPHLVLSHENIFLEAFEALVGQPLLKPVAGFRGLGENLDDQRRRALIVGASVDRPADHDEVRVVKGIVHPNLHVGHEHAARRSAKMLAQAGGDSEREQIMQAARSRHGIYRARDILMADVAGLFTFQIFCHRNGAEFLDKGHGQAASVIILDTQKSTLTGGKGNDYLDGGLGRDVIIGWSDGNNLFVGGSNTDTTDEGTASSARAATTTWRVATATTCSSIYLGA